MSELGRDARDFLASARGAHDAGAGAKDRVRAGLAAALTVGATAGAGSAALTTPAGARSAWLSAAKLATAIAIVGGGAWLLLGLERSKTSEQALSPTSTPSLHATPTPTLNAAPILTPTPNATPTPTPNATPTPTLNATPTPTPTPTPPPLAARAPSARSPQSSPAPLPTPEGSVAAEVAILQRIGAALRAGDPSRALDAVSEHARRFPDGALAEERDTQRIIALCALGRSDDATRAFTRFQRAYPGSTHEARIEAACTRAVAQP